VTAPLVGRNLAHYRVTAAIGAGGMGEVYRANDTKLGREVALKVLPSEVRQDEARLTRFKREATLLASLNHPNVAAIYGLEEADGMPFLALELVEGEDLAARLARGSIPIEEALGIAGQIADALAEAHQKGIVHRDLKPANVKVTPDGKVKVLDFGLAKAYAEDAAPDSGAELSRSPTLVHGGTLAGLILGTAAYMAPEQAKGGAVDKRADVWAFGCVLYEMLTCRRPFVGASVSDTLAEVLKGEPDWTRLPAATPPAIRRLLRRCLAKDRSRRLADVSDARLELEEAAAGSPVEVGAPPSPSRLGERLAWVAALLLVVAAAVVATLGRRTAAPAPEMRLEVTTPPTRDPASLALSPDGQHLVFAGASAGGRSVLWLRSLASGSGRPLPGTDGSALPFWAPSSRSIGFFSADRRLKRIDLDDGVVRELATASLPRGGAWNGDDTILFVPGTGSIYSMSATGGERTALTKLEASHSAHGFPSFLPDGRRFLYYVWGTPEVRGVYLTALGSGNGRRLLNADSPAVYAPPGHLLFLRGGTLYAQGLDPAAGATVGKPFAVADRIATGLVPVRAAAAVSASASGHIAYRTGGEPERRQFQWVDRSGRVLSAVGEPDSGAPMSPSLSRDGRRLAMHRAVDGNVDVWILDLARGAFSRFTSHSANEIHPLWSPDGTRIFFNSNRRGSYALFEKATDGAADETLVAAMQGRAADWSRDGSELLFERHDPTALSDVWIVPVGRGQEPRPLIQSEFVESDPQLSPDGAWIAFSSTETGRSEVYLQAFPGPGSRLPVSVDGGAQVRWRRDGRELFFIGLDDRMVSVAISFAGDGRSPRLAAPVPLFATSVGGAQQPGSRQQYCVSPDGQRFLMNTILEGAPASPITLILNWRARPSPGAADP